MLEKLNAQSVILYTYNHRMREYNFLLVDKFISSDRPNRQVII